ncbi:MAG: 6-carboxytetrahydropterin synthase [Bacteroidales bacterium]|nr:6-carboxytetrahydropterin synthase [Bacteroidales bacterium]
MSKLRITKEFRLEMAHALWNYKGKCESIHGHSYKLQVTVIGNVDLDSRSDEYGMVIDFKNLEKLIDEHILKKFDHSLLLYNDEKITTNINNKPLFERCYFVDFQPTCENIVLHFVNILKKVLPEKVALYSVKLWETETSMVEWNIENNMLI